MRIDKYRLADSIWGALIMSIVLSFAMPIIANGSITFEEFFLSVIVSFFAGLIIKLFSPIDKISICIANKCGAKKGTIKNSLCIAASTTLIMGTIMSLIMTWWGMHTIPDYQNQYIHGWISTYPWVLIIVFLMVNICHVSSKLVLKMIFRDNSHLDFEKQNLI